MSHRELHRRPRNFSAAATLRIVCCDITKRVTSARNATLLEWYFSRVVNTPAKGSHLSLAFRLSRTILFAQFRSNPDSFFPNPRALHHGGRCLFNRVTGVCPPERIFSFPRKKESRTMKGKENDTSWLRPRILLQDASESARIAVRLERSESRRVRPLVRECTLQGPRKPLQHA